MTQDEALALLQSMRQHPGNVPDIDRSAVAEWYVALRDETGVAREMKVLDQQIARLAGRRPGSG